MSERKKAPTISSVVRARRDIAEALGREPTNAEVVAARPGKARQDMHAAMAQETRDFVANGGVIEQIPMGVSGYVHDPFSAGRKTNGVGRSRMQNIPGGRGATAASKAARAKVISMAAKRAEATRRKASPASAGYDS